MGHTPDWVYIARLTFPPVEGLNRDLLWIESAGNQPGGAASHLAVKAPQPADLGHLDRQKNHFPQHLSAWPWNPDRSHHR